MPVEVVGAFTVIDKASRPIRNIRREAEKTDTAVARLGEHLDKIGTSEQRNRLNQVSGNMRKIAKEGGGAQTATKGLNKELDKAGASRKAQGIDRTARAVDNTARSAERADRSMAKLETTARKNERSFRAFGGEVKGLGIALKLALVPAVGLAIQGIGALGVGVGSLLPQLSSFGALMAPLGAGIAGIGAAMITAKLASHDLGKALGGNKAALKGLTPQAREFVRTLKQYQPLVKQLQSASQRGLFPGLDLAVRRLVTAAPVVKSILRSMGGTLGGVASSVARFGTRGGFLRDLEMLTGQGGALIGRGAHGLMNVADAFRHLFVAAMPFTDWLSKTVVGWTDWAKGAAFAGRESGTFARFLRRARTDLEQFGRIGKNVFGGTVATLRELRPLGDVAWRGIERLTDRWATWAQSTSGRQDMRRYFSEMAAPLRQVVGLAGDLGKGIGQLARGRGFTESVRELRRAVPTLTQGLNAMAEGLGPQIVGALSQVVTLFGTLSKSGGTLSQVVRLFGGLVGSVNWLFEHIPGLGTVIGTALSVMALSRFATMLGGLAGKWRSVGRAAAGAAVQEEAAMMSGGGGVGGRGGTTVVPGRFGRVRGAIRGIPGRIGPGGAAMVGAVGAGVAGQAVGGGAGAALGGAGTGAALGATIGSIVPGLGTAVGAGVGAGAGALIGFLSNRSSSRQNAAGLGQDQALQLLAGGANAGAIQHRMDLLEGRLHERRVVQQATSGPNLGMAPTGSTIMGGFTLGGAQRRQVQAQLDALRPALKVQVQLERQQAVRAARDAGSRMAASLGQAFNVYNRRYGLNKSMELVRHDVVHGLGQLGPVGRRQMAQNMIDWAREQARQNPKLWGAVHRLTDRIEERFRDLGQNIQVVNGQILDGSQKQWDGISKALSDPVERAREKIRKAFTGMQQEAVGALTQSGFTRSEAQDIVRGLEKGGGSATRSQNAIDLGASKVHGLHAQNAKNARGAARGGRIPGQGLFDTVPVAPGMLAAPGELIANRHTEHRVDRMLAAFGTSLGREVAGESRPHHAALGSRVTAADRAATAPGQTGLQAGIQRGAQMVLGQFPGLSITSTTTGGHAAHSYHYRGMAVDIGGSPALMDRAAAWIGQHMGASLLEGIHNPNLSIKDGKTVPPSFWGASTWAAHMNHIHMAMGGSGGIVGIPGFPASTGDLGGISLRRRKTGVGGVGGALGDKVIESVRSNLEDRINQAVMGGAGGGGGAGVMSFNQVARLAESVGLPGVTFAQIARGESGFNPRAIGHDPGGTRGLGLWQITTGYNDDIIRQFGGEQAMFTPRINALAARAIYDRQGIGAWYGTRYMTAPNLHYTGAAMGGRVPEWGGWHAQGGRRRFSRPTLIGVGDGGVPEDVQVTPVRGNRRGGGATINVHPGAIVIQGAGRNADAIADEVMRRLTRLIEGLSMEPEGAIS